MEEDELLFAQHNEQSVYELGHLAQQEQPAPAAVDAVRVVVAAHRVLEAVRAQRVHELGPDARRAHEAEGGEHEVPGDERAPQVELVAAAHPRLAAEDERDVEQGVEEAELPVAQHPLLLRLHVALVEELLLVEEEAGVVEARLRAVHALDHDWLVHIIFEAHADSRRNPKSRRYI